MRCVRNRLQRARGARAGATVLEITIASVLLLMTAGMTIRAVVDMRGAATLTTVNSQLSAQGERAIERIMDDLRRSGVASVGGLNYPHMFSAGDAGAGFENHDHTPAPQAVAVDSPDYVTPREIIFLQPADADAPGAAGAGRPDVDADGQLVWDTREFSYVVEQVNGRNELQRRIDGASPQVVCRDVEWIRFDDNTQPGAGALPTGALRVRLALRDVDATGRAVRWETEVVVRLRNG
jgi:hypothetical protein